MIKHIKKASAAKNKPNKAVKEQIYEKIPLFAKISLILAAVCVVIYFISTLSEGFADFFNIYIAVIFRFLFAQLTNIIPLSLAELLILLLPILLGIALWYLLKYRCRTKKATLVSLICIVSAASLLFSSFVLTFSSGYRGSTIDKKLGLEQKAIGGEELYASAVYLIGEINALSERIDYGEDDFSVMPYDLNEMNKKLIKAFDDYCKDNYFINNFYSKIKPVMHSEAMSYTHITGVYTFFTGEANINVNFPDYTIPYTAAHELAHQRGIAREDEANLIAFLVSIRSDDNYILYCAYLNMYEYIASALYKADKELYKEAVSTLDIRVRRELSAYSKFFNKYRESTASKVSNKVNDTYLKAQGTVGKKSYGMVVDLAVAYFKSEKIIKN